MNRASRVFLQKSFFKLKFNISMLTQDMIDEVQLQNKIADLILHVCVNLLHVSRPYAIVRINGVIMNIIIFCMTLEMLSITMIVNKNLLLSLHRQGHTAHCHSRLDLLSPPCVEV